MNHTIKAKRKSDGEIIDIFTVDYKTCLGEKIKYVDGLLGNYTEGQFNDLFEVVEDRPQTDTLKKEDWEERKQYLLAIIGKGIADTVSTIMSERTGVNHYVDSSEVYNFSNEINDFITQEIAKAKEERDGEIVEKVEKVENSYDYLDSEWYEGFETARKIFIKLINNK